MQQQHDIFGLVLAGGKSTRMEVDKGLIDYHGHPQREFLFVLLKKYCGSVFTSCRSGQQLPAELNPLEDQFAIKSPMNGILTAFGKHPDKAWIIIAVDMPHVNDLVIEQLISNRNKEKVAACFYNKAEDFPEPLLTLWEPKAFPLVKRFVDQGRISPKDFLKENDTHLIVPANEKILLNINSQDEYRAFKKPD